MIRKPFLLLLFVLFLPFAANALEIQAKPGDTIVATSGKTSSSSLEILPDYKNVNNYAEIVIYNSNEAREFGPIIKGGNFYIKIRVGPGHPAFSSRDIHCRLFAVISKTLQLDGPYTRENWLKSAIPYREFSVDLHRSGNGEFSSNILVANPRSFGVDHLYHLVAITDFTDGENDDKARVLTVDNNYKIFRFIEYTYLSKLYSQVGFDGLRIYRQDPISKIAGKQQVSLLSETSGYEDLHGPFVTAELFVRRNGSLVSKPVEIIMHPFSGIIYPPKDVISDEKKIIPYYLSDYFTPLFLFREILKDGDEIVSSIYDPSKDTRIETSALYVKPKPHPLSITASVLEGGRWSLADTIGHDGKFMLSVKMRNTLIEDEIPIEARVTKNDAIKEIVTLSAHRVTGTPLIYKTSAISLSSDKRFIGATDGDLIEFRLGETWPWSKGTKIRINNRGANIVVRSKKGTNYNILIYDKNGYSANQKTNKIFTLSPGAFDISVQSSLEFKQKLHVSSGSEVCIELPTESLGTIKIGTSNKPGELTPIHGLFKRLRPVKRINNWCKDYGPKPDNFKAGQWRNEGAFLGDRVAYELPAGQYEVNADALPLFSGKEDREFTVAAGQKADHVIKTGLVGISVQDKDGKLLPAGRVTISRSSGEGAPVGHPLGNGGQVRVTPGSYELSYASDKFDLKKIIDVAHGCDCMAVINTGRVWFDKGIKESPAMTVNLSASQPNGIIVHDLETGGFIDLPGGTYGYWFEGSTEEEGVKTLDVASNTEQHISAPVPNGELSITWPSILKNSGRFPNWDFNIYAFPKGDSHKVRLDQGGGLLKQGKYTIEIAGTYHVRRETPQQLIVDPIEIIVNPGEKKNLNVEIGELILRNGRSEPFNIRLTRSNRIVAERYLSKENPMVKMFLSPGTYRAVNIDNKKNNYIVNIVAGNTYKIER